MNKDKKKTFSIIVPFLPKEKELLVELLSSLKDFPFAFELILSSTESYDSFIQTASDNLVLELNECMSKASLGFDYLCGEASRAKQMNLAAAKAKQEILWFLHVDTKMMSDSFPSIRANIDIISKARNGFYFQLNFHDAPVATRINALFTRWRSNFLGMIYGDQALMIPSKIFKGLNAYTESLSYGEDHDFVWRARLAGVRWLELGKISSSGRAYQGRWFSLTMKRIFLGFLQASPFFWKSLNPFLKRKNMVSMTSSEKTLEMNSDAFSYKRVLETESLVGSTEREKQIAVAVFVKTPGHSALKTRLAKSIGYPKAENFHIRSCKAIEALLLNLREKSPQFHPYWAVAEEEALGHSLWSNFPCLLQGQGDLGSRLSEIYSSLLQDFDYVLLMGADCPFMAKEDILQAVSLLENSSDFCLGEAEDGGYYLFGGKKEIPKELWLKVPYSQENTAKVFSEELLKLGSLNKDLPVLFDVDTVQDYEIAMKQAFI